MLLRDDNGEKFEVAGADGDWLHLRPVKPANFDMKAEDLGTDHPGVWRLPGAESVATYHGTLWYRGPIKVHKKQLERYGRGYCYGQDRWFYLEDGARALPGPTPAPAPQREFTMAQRAAFAELGLKPGATASEIRRAWRRAVSLHHPDLGGCEHNFYRARCAFELIKDRGQR